MKSNLRKVLRSIIKESIKKEIKKTIIEKYSADDVMIGSLSDIINNFEIEDFPEKQYEKTADLDDEINDYKNNKTNTARAKNQEDTAAVEKYFLNNYPNTISHITKSIAFTNSPLPEALLENVPNGEEISPEEQALYNENYEKSKRAASSVLANIEGDNDVKDAIYTASKLCNVPLKTLYTFAAIESAGKQNVSSPSGNHVGLFQFGNSASRSVGFIGKDVLKDNTYTHKLNNSVAACNYMKIHAEKTLAQAIGINTYSLYLMHQQGSAGANKIYRQLLSNSSSLTGNQTANRSSIGKDKINTNRKWMIGWLGRINGFEDEFNNVSGGNIRVPRNSSVQTLGQVPASNTVSKATWKNVQPGTILRKGINFDKTFDDNNNYRAGLNAAKYNYNKDFFNEIKQDYNIENVVTMLTPSEGGKQISGAIKSADLNSYYYKIGHPDELSEAQIQEIFDVITSGNTLIHCNHGADRTGSILGAYYLKKELMDYNSAEWDHMEYQGKANDDAIVIRNLNFIKKYDT